MSLISQSVDHSSHEAYFYKASLNVSYRCDYSWHTATTPGTGLLLDRTLAVPKVGDYSWHGLLLDRDTGRVYGTKMAIRNHSNTFTLH